VKKKGQKQMKGIVIHPAKRFGSGKKNKEAVYVYM